MVWCTSERHCDSVEMPRKAKEPVMHVAYRCDFPQEIHLRLACEPEVCETIRTDFLRWFREHYPTVESQFSATITGAINERTIEEAAAEAPRWVPVEDSLPQFGERVAVFDKFGRRTVAYIAHLVDGEPTWTQDGCGQWEWPNVTHWLRMPSPPQRQRKALPSPSGLSGGPAKNPSRRREGAAREGGQQ
jgi:hypothetical protein